MHEFIQLIRKIRAGHLTALTLIRLGYAPAQSILVVLLTALNCKLLFVLAKKQLYKDHIFQTVDAGGIERDTAFSDRNSRITQVCKQLLADNHKVIASESLFKLSSSEFLFGSQFFERHFFTRRHHLLGHILSPILP